MSEESGAEVTVAVETPAESTDGAGEANAHADRASAESDHASESADDSAAAAAEAEANSATAAAAASAAIDSAIVATQATETTANLAETITAQLDALPGRIKEAILEGIAERDNAATEATEVEQPSPEDDLAPGEQHWYVKPLWGSKKNKAVE